MLKKNLNKILMVVILVSALLSWWSIDRAIMVESASNFWWPFLIFSILAVCLVLFFALERQRLMILAVCFGVTALSLIFVFKAGHLLFVLVGVLLLFKGWVIACGDFDSSLKISFRRNSQRSIFYIIVALSLIVTSQYYFTVRNLPEINLSLDSNKLTNGIIDWSLSKVSPDFSKMKSDQISMDDFLAELYEVISAKQSDNKMNDILSSSASVSESELRQIVVDDWKKQLSQTAGFKIAGDEKVNDVFVALINSRMSKFSVVRGQENSPQLLSFVLALILLLTLLSLGPFLRFFWLYLASMVFWILKKTAIVRVKLEDRLAEIIV